MPDPILRFDYPGIDTDDRRDDPDRRHFYLCKTDLLVTEIQVMAPGAGVNLHTHLDLTGVWIVLSGHFTFYGAGETVYAELDPLQGLLIPAGSHYWFKNTGAVTGEVMRVDVQTPPGHHIAPEKQVVLDAFGTDRWAPFADPEHEARRGVQVARTGAED
jgi:mannose-6-phosphate isomerase-like protein (cupin superfamily)